MIKVLGGVLSAVMSVFAKKAEAGTESSPKHPIIAFVALSEPQLPTVDEVVSHMNENWPSSGTFRADQSNATQISISGPEEDVFYVAQLVDAPIPADDFQFACSTSMGWPTACEELGKMRAHAIVTALDRSGNVGKATFGLSAFTQAVAASSRSIGIYLGEADTVWSREQFSTATLPSSADDPPYLLWIGLKAEKEADGTISIVTRGMGAYGFKNIEIQHSKSDGNDGMNVVLNTAYYLLQNGDDLKDGDTIGGTEDEKIDITFGSSILDASEKVFVIHY